MKSVSGCLGKKVLVGFPKEDTTKENKVEQKKEGGVWEGTNYVKQVGRWMDI